MAVDEVVPLGRPQGGHISDDGIAAPLDDVSSLVLTPNDGIDVASLLGGVLSEVLGHVPVATNDEDSICCHVTHPRTDRGRQG